MTTREFPAIVSILYTINTTIKNDNINTTPQGLAFKPTWLLRRTVRTSWKPRERPLVGSEATIRTSRVRSNHVGSGRIGSGWMASSRGRSRRVGSGGPTPPVRGLELSDDQGYGRGGTPIFTGVFEPLARVALYPTDEDGLGTWFAAA